MTASVNRPKRPVELIPRGLISDLLDMYDTETLIVQDFFEDILHPSRELNYQYRELLKRMDSVVAEAHIHPNSGTTVTLKVFYIPFDDLFSAEKELREQGKTLHDEEVRNSVVAEMHATYRWIKDLLHSSVVTEKTVKDGETQKMIEGAKILISQEVEARRKKVEASQPERVSKIEITALPEVRVRDAEENVVIKGKERMHLPHFKSTEWTQITIHFTSEHEVVVTIGKENYALTYEILGFEDAKSNKPNRAWTLLYSLACRGGVSEELPTPIPDTTKQQKMQLSDRLQAIFKNDSDPFYNTADSHVYRIKLNLVPPQNVTESSTNPEVDELFSELIADE